MSKSTADMLNIRKTPEIYPMTSMQETLEYFLSLGSGRWLACLYVYVVSDRTALAGIWRSKQQAGEPEPALTPTEPCMLL
jgi:hypothetical protein